MTSSVSTCTRVRLHLTNVTGAGATQLLQSLVPALESDPTAVIEHIYIPDRGQLAAYCSSNSGCTVVEVYRRHLPNGLSRMLECTWLAGHFDGNSPLLVLGDLPLHCQGPQTLFVQTPNLLKPACLDLSIIGIKYWITRLLFRLGSGGVRAFIVQTEVMKEALESSYPSIVGRVHVIAQPVPSWLLHSGLERHYHPRTASQRLKLIYPAAGYPHKNHALLSRINLLADWPVEQLVLTIDSEENPAPKLPWIKCRGFLSPQKMIEAYAEVDALLFLSKKESYGFPLVEAMFIGIPIICPDLPYARILCGDQAVFFDPDKPESLHKALIELRSKLDNGWWPTWQEKLNNVPRDWKTVARKMLEVTRL